MSNIGCCDKEMLRTRLRQHIPRLEIGDETKYFPIDGKEGVQLMVGVMDLLQFRPRAKVEYDETLLQIIPYVVLVHETRVFRFTRVGGEVRLTGLKSIGVGGHIEEEDRELGLKKHTPLIIAGAMRELDEEVEYSAPELLTFDWVPRGVVCGGAHSVHRVHLGLVFAFPVAGVAVKEKESLRGELDEAGSVVADMGCDAVNWENWSLVLRPLLESLPLPPHLPGNHRR
jgi:predicted NUDIX family phosphoesterase